MSTGGRLAMLRDERGFTLVEVMMAAVMLVAIIGAASALFVHGNDSSIAVQRQSQLISVADQQIETIRQQVKTEGFNRLAMSGAPAALPSGFPSTSIDATTKADPGAFAFSLTGCGASNEEYLIEANYDNTAENQPKNPQNTAASGVTPWSGCTSTTTQVGEPLEMLSNGFVTAQQTVTVGTDTAVVDTYVTDTYVGCNSGGFAGCPTVTSNTVSCSTWPTTTASTACGDARRVTVAVVLNDHGRFSTGPSAPVYVSSVFTNPTPSNTPTSSIGLTLGVQLG